jgi:hypothetical protein
MGTTHLDPTTAHGYQYGIPINHGTKPAAACTFFCGNGNTYTQALSYIREQYEPSYFVVYLTTLSVAQDTALDDSMINWKEYGRKQPWPNLRYYPCIFLKELKKTKKVVSRYLVSRLKFEPNTSQV